MWHCNGVGAWDHCMFEFALEVVVVVCIEVSGACIEALVVEGACIEVWRA